MDDAGRALAALRTYEKFVGSRASNS
jgi:hypothetical protein